MYGEVGGARASYESPTPRIAHRAEAGMLTVKGHTLDDQTRCIHYHSPLDVIAIKFKCCGEYYPCYACHAEAVNHPVAVWQKNEWQTKVILCGVCHADLTVYDYVTSHHRCPACQAPFNPQCRQHYHLYFAL